MRRKVVSGIMLTLLSIGMLTLTFNIQPVEASGTIYIRADGSIEPSTANITSTDNVTYYFTGNINESIVVERDNIVVDGAGYTLQGTGSGTGITLSGRSNVKIKNTRIKSFGYGIWLEDSSNNSICGNGITNNDDGVYLSYSSGNSIFGNNITNNVWQGISLFILSGNSIFGNNITNNGGGIHFWGSSNNSISGNNITNNHVGIYLFISSNNKFYHNNFINNADQVHSYQVNIWDDGYPSGGNYWSDYTGVDLFSGPYQNETGSDGIVDDPYEIDGDDTDRYPLMNSYQPVEFNATKNGENYSITTVSNSTITDFNFSYPLQKMSFNVTGPSNTTGYCNIVIPKDLITLTIVVLVNGNPLPYNMEENATHIFIYFTYNHSTNKVEILATILGDVNGDRKVTITDIVIVALAFGSRPGDSNWNPILDLNQDGKISITDIVIVALHFGETW